MVGLLMRSVLNTSRAGLSRQAVGQVEKFARLITTPTPASIWLPLTSAELLLAQLQLTQELFFFSMKEQLIMIRADFGSAPPSLPTISLTTVAKLILLLAVALRESLQPSAFPVRIPGLTFIH